MINFRKLFKYTHVIFVCILSSPSGLLHSATADFLNIGVHARALVFGDSFSAITNNSSAFYWNPSGLSFSRQVILSGMYAPQYGNWNDALASYHHIGMTIPLKDACLAINYICLQVDDIPVYPALQGSSFWDRFYNQSLRPTGETLGSISDKESAIFFSFSKMLQHKFELGWQYNPLNIKMPLGISFKTIHQQMGAYSASGIGMDAGVSIHVALKDFFQSRKNAILQFGFVRKNLVNTRLTWNTKQSDMFLQETMTALSLQYPINKNHSFSTALSHSLHCGLEYIGWKRFGIRLGLQKEKLIIGAGLMNSIFNIDYAFKPHSLGNNHQVSCDLYLEALKLF